VTDMLLQPDDKIVLGGYSTNGNGTAGSFLIRLLVGSAVNLDIQQGVIDLSLIYNQNSFLHSL
ncbi:MAG TPA: delta-60 repeat domain-containing protein, partial [Leptospiraceae bacterium]|nr:delta-60 repeat domain-containing protein [Leptospiraceae bacterium]